MKRWIRLRGPLLIAVLSIGSWMTWYRFGSATHPSLKTNPKISVELTGPNTFEADQVVTFKLRLCNLQKVPVIISTYCRLVSIHNETHDVFSTVGDARAPVASDMMVLWPGKTEELNQTELIASKLADVRDLRTWVVLGPLHLPWPSATDKKRIDTLSQHGKIPMIEDDIDVEMDYHPNYAD